MIEEHVVVRIRLHKEEKPNEQESKVLDKVLKSQLEEKLGWQDLTHEYRAPATANNQLGSRRENVPEKRRNGQR